MNTPVKRAKSTVLGKKCNPSLGPTKHRKVAVGTEKDVSLSLSLSLSVRVFSTLKALINDTSCFSDGIYASNTNYCVLGFSSF